jgi:hypothetical protein
LITGFTYFSQPGVTGDLMPRLYRRAFIIGVWSAGVATLSGTAFADPGVSADKILFGQAAVLSA